MEQQEETTNTSQEPSNRVLFNKKKIKKIIIGSIIALIAGLFAAFWNFIFAPSSKTELPATIAVDNRTDNHSIFNTENHSLINYYLKDIYQNENLTAYLFSKRLQLNDTSRNNREFKANDGLIKIKSKKKMTNLGHKFFHETVIKKDDNRNIKKDGKNTLFRGFSLSETPDNNDVPIVEIDSTKIKYDDYPNNGGGIIFITNCKDCDWLIYNNRYGYPPDVGYSVIVSKDMPSIMPESYYPLFAYRTYNFFIYDKKFTQYGPFKLTFSPGKTITFHISKKM